MLAVLDWELSTLGDPLSDAAYSCLAHYIPADSPMLKGLMGLPQSLESLGIPADLEFMQAYCKNMDIEGGSVEDVWYFYLSLGFFRIAAILQGVYKRSLNNQARFCAIRLFFPRLLMSQTIANMHSTIPSQI